MIEAGVRPRLAVVAVTTKRPVPTLVYVINQVTGSAFLADVVVKKIALVTVAASGFPVLTQKRKVTGLTMIKGGFFPLPCSVALLAFLTVLALVIIVDLMAGVATCGGPFIALVDMAHLTFNRIVRTGQLETTIF